MRFAVSAVAVLVPWTFLNIQCKCNNMARGWEAWAWAGHTHEKQLRWGRSSV